MKKSLNLGKRMWVDIKGVSNESRVQIPFKFKKGGCNGRM